LKLVVSYKRNNFLFMLSNLEKRGVTTTTTTVEEFDNQFLPKPKQFTLARRIESLRKSMSVVAGERARLISLGFAK